MRKRVDSREIDRHIFKLEIRSRMKEDIDKLNPKEIRELFGEVVIQESNIIKIESPNTIYRDLNSRLSGCRALFNTRVIKTLKKMSSEPKGILVPMTVILFVFTLFIGGIGWMTNRTLDSIDTSLKDMSAEIKKLDGGKNDHEIRLVKIEEKLNGMKIPESQNNNNSYHDIP